MGNKPFKKKIKGTKKRSRSKSADQIDAIVITLPKQESRTELPKVRALYSYESRENYDLGFEKNDILLALEDPKDKSWYKALNTRTNAEGLIPYNYVVVEDGSPSSLDCYMDVNRVEAERLLQIMGIPDGSYLIRPSTDRPNIALSVRILDVNDVWIVRHFMIKKAGNQWYLTPDTKFYTVESLLKYYTESHAHVSCRLVKPLPRDERPVIQFKDMEVNRNNFIKEEVLGKGNFGEVWKARWGANSNHFVAIKIVQSSMMSNEQFLAEAKIMHSLKHRRIVELLGVCTKPDNEPIYIITEYMVNGSLLNFLRSPRGKSLTFMNMIDTIAQISEGMAYLESKKFIHRDLRAANILVDSNLFVKVADFGLARMIEDSYVIQDSKFPVRWTAPEAALEGKFTIKSDVWSFGILVYEIITYGVVPYANLQTREVIAEIVRNDYRLTNPNGQSWIGMSIHCPTTLYNMMLNCWNKEPETRPTFESLMHIFTTWSISTEAQYEDQ